MKYRQSVLHEKESITADKVFTVDMNTEDPISRIDLHVRGTNNLSVPTAHPAKLLTKIEVVDGSEVIYSLSGVQAQAAHYWHSGRGPVNILNYLNDVQAQAAFAIPFGRWLWDPEWALDPKRYKNLQLKVTYDEDGGGSAPDAGSFEAIAHLFDQKKINPIGLLTHKEHYSYTIVASGIETVQLPVDLPIRMVILQSLTADKAPNDQYNVIKLDEDNDKRILIDQQTADLLKYVLQDWDAIVETVEGVATGSEVNHFITPSYEVAAAFGGNDGYLSYYAQTSKYGGVLGVHGNNAGYNFAAVVRGWCPHGSLALLMGDKNDPEDWWDVRMLKSARAKITAGSGGSGTNSIIVQQAKRY